MEGKGERRSRETWRRVMERTEYKSRGQ